MFVQVLSISKDVALQTFLLGRRGVRIYPYTYSEFPMLQLLSIAFQRSHVLLQEKPVSIFFTTSHYAVTVMTMSTDLPLTFC